jgi:hypothetical protein
VHDEETGFNRMDGIPAKTFGISVLGEWNGSAEMEGVPEFEQKETKETKRKRKLQKLAKDAKIHSPLRPLSGPASPAVAGPESFCKSFFVPFVSFCSKNPFTPSCSGIA